jgi:glycosyltransferase involved in cell wall biosynthesis
MSSTKVSVLIPVYNGERTIARCVESALAQDYPQLEIIVVDDCSTDATASALDPYRERINAVRNEHNSGIARTYNRALRESSGTVVVMLASDCALVGSDYVSRMVGHFESPAIAAVAGKAVIENFDAVPSVERIFAKLNLLDINDDDRGTHDVNFVEVRCDGFRRDVLETVGGLNEDLFRSNEDQDLSIRIARLGYRLIQDNTLEFELGFGGTEDSLGKLLSKQGQYARGQAYIAVNYGLGSKSGLWTNANRRARAVHRMGQVGFGPLLLLSLFACAFTPFGTAAVAALLAWRGVHDYALTKGLRAGERLAGIPLGIASDAIYSTLFLTSAAIWIAQGKSALSGNSASSTTAAQ